MLDFLCHLCTQHIVAEQAQAGVMAHCPTCRGVIVVPFGTQAPAPGQPPPLAGGRQQMYSNHTATTEASAATASATVPQGTPRTTFRSFFNSVFYIGLIFTLIMAVVATGFVQVNEKKDSLTIYFLVVSLLVAAVVVFASGLLSTIVTLLVRSGETAFQRIFAPTNAICMMLMATVLCLGCVGVRVNKVTSAAKNRELAEYRMSIEKMRRSLVDENGLPKKTDFRLDIKEAPANDAQVVMNLMNQLTNELLEIQNEYMKELNDAGIARLLVADRIAADKDFQQSLAILLQVNSIAIKYKKKVETYVFDMPKRANDLKLPEARRKLVQKEMETSIQQRKGRFDEIWSLEMKSVSLMATMIDMLKQSQDYWTVENNKFVFRRQEDLRAYNSIMAEAVQCIERQAKLKDQDLREVIKNLGG